MQTGIQTDWMTEHITTPHLHVVIKPGLGTFYVHRWLDSTLNHCLSLYVCITITFITPYVQSVKLQWLDNNRSILDLLQVKRWCDQIYIPFYIGLKRGARKVMHDANWYDEDYTSYKVCWSSRTSQWSTTCRYFRPSLVSRPPTTQRPAGLHAPWTHSPIAVSR